jgi:hypothetical protein
MAGAILLLLTGTSLLEWYWIALLATASLALGLYRFRKRIPSEYRLAQRIDWKLNLADALSTAKYFAGDHSPIVDQQRQSAARIARTIDPRVAVPFTRSRFAWPALGLALVACGLFAVRYAVTGTMSLQPSLVKMAYDSFFSAPQQQARNNARKSPVDPNSPLDPGNPDAPTTQNDQTPESQLQSVETPDVNNAMAEDQSKSAAPQGQNHPTPDDQQGDNDDKGEKGDKAADSDKNNDEKPTEGDKSKDKQKDDKNQKPNPDNSSMLDKLKDAMANMLNKMKSTPPKEGQQSAQNNKDSKAGGQEKGKQKGSKSDSNDADAQSDQQDQQGDKSEQKQSANAKSGDKSQDKNNSPDAKSGIGSSDGDKSAKEAELEKAMGKISEIIGKRAQNVTGEVMVEVGSTRQQLKTPWAQKQATHV